MSETHSTHIPVCVCVIYVYTYRKKDTFMSLTFFPPPFWSWEIMKWGTWNIWVLHTEICSVHFQFTKYFYFINFTGYSQYRHRTHCLSVHKSIILCRIGSTITRGQPLFCQHRPSPAPLTCHWSPTQLSLTPVHPRLGRHQESLGSVSPENFRKKDTKLTVGVDTWPETSTVERSGVGDHRRWREVSQEVGLQKL